MSYFVDIVGFFFLKTGGRGGRWRCWMVRRVVWADEEYITRSWALGWWVFGSGLGKCMYVCSRNINFGDSLVLRRRERIDTLR